MNGNPDDARSDMLLAAAAYLFGPLFVGLFLQFVPLLRVPVLGEVLIVTLPLVFTVLVPFLLIRYRDESPRDYGFGDGPDSSALLGLLAGLPIVAAGLLVGLVRHQDLVAGLPMFPGDGLLALGSSSPVLVTLERVTRWVGLLLLALYVSTKARDAFRSAPADTAHVVRKVGLVIGVGAAVTTVLLFLSMLGDLDLGRTVAVLLGPVAVAASVFVVTARVGLRGSLVMPVVVAPVVLLAVGPFRFTLQTITFLNGLYGAALFAGIGLAVALLVDRTRRALGVVMLGLVIATLTTLGPAGFV